MGGNPIVQVTVEFPFFRPFHLRIEVTRYDSRGEVAGDDQVVAGRQPAAQRRGGAGLVAAQNPVSERLLGQYAAQGLVGERFLHIVQVDHQIALHQHGQDALAHLVAVWCVAHDRRRVSGRHQRRNVG